MGNQPGKLSVKSSKYIEDVDPKNSRTNWIAGVASPPGRPTIELSSRIAAKEEDSVTDEINLTWAVPQDDGGYPITGYRVEMLDIQSGRWIEVTFIEGYEPKCTLSNILYGIMYRFRVVALNDAGASEPGEPSEPVVIDVPGVQIAPYFVQMLNDTIALEHEKVEFRVRVLGTPKPSIQWYKDDVEIFACDRIEMREEDEGGAVILKEARLSDSGVIKCVASNILGRCTSTAQFSIEAAPRFDLPETYNEGLIFRHEEVIRLRVPMIAKPAPKVVWFFEDEPISAGSDLTIETTETFTSLRIQGAKRWHCGEFRVYAENEYGEDAVSILVTVTSPPSPPGRPVVIDISETKCTLRWEPSEDDGGADVKHYIVEYFRDVWEVWLKAKTTKDTIVTIDDLIPGSRYKFRIKAENSYGISDPGDESNPFDVGGVSGSDSRRTNNTTTSLKTSSEDVAISIPSAPRPKRWSDIMHEDDAELDDYMEAEAVNIEVTPETPMAPKRKKPLWGATASEDNEEDILDRFLKVKKFQENQAPSYESDGIPSIVGIEDNDSEVGSSIQKRRGLFAELEQLSNDHPDLESISEADDVRSSKSDLKRARELYEELRQMSVETGGSIENLMEGINTTTSNESISSIIPYEKRQELSRFEMTLKQMIEEAKQMAKTPSPSLLDEDENLYRKSPSVHSMAESIVSVIERRNSGYELQPQKQTLEVVITEPPVAFEEDNNKLQPPERPPRSPSPGKLRRLSDAGFDFSQPVSQPQPPSPPRPLASLQRRRSSAAAKASNEPLIGADRYEEIIEARGRRGSSVVSGPRSVQGSMTNLFQPNSTMAMREEIRPTTSRTSLMRSSETFAKSNEKLGLVQPNLNNAAVKVPSPQPVLVAKPIITSNVVKKEAKPFVAMPIEPSIDPLRPETLAKIKAANQKSTYPDWLIITLAYSMVFVAILLVSNIIPNGRLYIHFTAFWSMILYFVIDDVDGHSSTDVLETVMENFVKVKK